MCFLELAEIVWFEATDHYITVHSRSGIRLIRESMAHLEARLDARHFLRVHRSAIVNVAHIRELRAPLREECEVVLDTSEVLPVSRRRGRALKSRLGL